MFIIPRIRMNIQLLAGSEDDDQSLENRILKLQEQLEKMEEIIKENENLKKTNELLFDKNQEYFLKITGTNNNNDDDQDNEYEEFVGSDFYNKLSSKEKKQLQIILEGEDE